MHLNACLDHMGDFPSEFRFEKYADLISFQNNLINILSLYTF